MTESEEPKTYRKGKYVPESTLQVALHIAQELMAAEKEQVAAIEEITHRFPPLAQVVRFAPGLRYGGKVTKRWNRFFNTILPRYFDVASFSYEVIAGEAYDRKHSTLSLEAREWQFMNETFAAIVGAVLAKLYELLQELKVAMELDTKSEERKAFLQALTRPEEKKSRTSIGLITALEEMPSSNGDEP